ncbi:ras guanine nucleotide exchange factor domain-containing protein [Multifurca ochricompacta]|uniref:Ras guanine nucleotide exchange factor domain-containing protein n=1 Tax=Multifurca ochricompacta TaxID=376703 RepID=A0AAD4M8L6_9AGAM|nr:ras guanine nucleotide exchange factor domain-containing protein [Multifurca ochricompacta]
MPSKGRACSQKESLADRTHSHSGRRHPHRTMTGPKEMQHSSTSVDGSCAPGKQMPIRRSIRNPATAIGTKASGMELVNENIHFQEAVAIGESLEGEMESFLPLLEGVPPQFRSRGYHHGKNEFLNVKAILSETVKTLKAASRADVHMIAHQYLLFKDIIYDNLRSLLLWLDAELERYWEIQQKGLGELLHEGSENLQPSNCSQSVPRSHLRGQSVEIMESPILGELSRPRKQFNTRCSIFSEVASSLTPIPNSPLDVEMPAPVGEAAYFVIEDGVVKCASLSALIVILTNPKPSPIIKHFDQLHDTFLLSFRYFSTSSDLVRVLIARFQLGQPRDLTREQECVWPLHLQAIQLRVVNIFRAWVDLYWAHEDDRLAAPLIQHFAESIIGPRWPEAGGGIVQGLKRRLQEFNHPSLSRDHRRLEATAGATLGVKFPLRHRNTTELLDTYSAKAPFGEDTLGSAISADDLVRNDHVAHVLVFNSDQHCTELARQLTLFMSTEFRAVDPERLWHHLRMQCPGCPAEQAVKTLQLHALALQVWTIRSVLAQDDAETRTGVMTFLIALAFRCRKLRNFSALCSIYTGLTSGFTEKLSRRSLR